MLEASCTFHVNVTGIILSRHDVVLSCTYVLALDEKVARVHTCSMLELLFILFALDEEAALALERMQQDRMMALCETRERLQRGNALAANRTVMRYIVTLELSYSLALWRSMSLFLCLSLS